MEQAMKTIVVGTGFGCRVHVPALRAAGFDVAGLVGTDPARLARKAAEAGIAAGFTNLDAAIAETGARLALIATPPATHAPLVLAAIARGCHVLCEKPFALDACQAALLLAAAEAAGVVHAIAHEFRWAPDRAAFGHAIADGLIGASRFLLVDQLLSLYADPAFVPPGTAAMLATTPTATAGRGAVGGGSGYHRGPRKQLLRFASPSRRPDPDRC